MDIIICENEYAKKVKDYEADIAGAAKIAMSKGGREGDIDIAIVGQEEIRRLNREFRGVDSVTDVLSFPSEDMEGSEFLGDIAICWERALSQAEEYGHIIKRELAFLTVHGTLHIIGFDHITEAEEKEMFELQNSIMKELGISR